MSLRIESSVVTWLVVAVAPAFALISAGCGEDFGSCESTRTCRSTGKGGSGGDAGEGGSPDAPLGGAGNSGRGGGGNGNGMGGSRGGASGTSGDGGASGEDGASGDGGASGNAGRAGAAGSAGSVTGESGSGGEGGDAVEPPDPCESVTCEHGACANVNGDGICDCEPGFAGKACELPAFEWVSFLPEHDFAEPVALSENGTVFGVGCREESCPSTRRWFRWTHEEGSVVLGGSEIAKVSAANRDASVVVGELSTTTAGGQRAFRWTQPSGFVSLSVLPGGDGSLGSTAHAVSADGSVVVGTSGKEPFRWTLGSGMVKLALLDGQPWDASIGAFFVSADGSVIVGRLVSSSPSMTNVLRWTAVNEVERIEFDGNAHATGMSADGEVVVGDADFSGVTEAFRWTRSGGMVSLGTPSECSSTRSRAVSGDGRTVAVSCLWNARPRWYVWDVNVGFRRLDDILASTGADVSSEGPIEAFRLSFDGSTILGLTVEAAPLYRRRAWIARLPNVRD